MRYSLLVTAGPDHQASLSALRTARALCSAGHVLHRVFLYREGVQLADGSRRCASGDPDVAADWGRLLDECAIDGVACIGTAQRYGILDEREGARLAGEASLRTPWRLAGLGEWVDAMIRSDRVLQFGA